MPYPLGVSLLCTYVHHTGNRGVAGNVNLKVGLHEHAPVRQYPLLISASCDGRLPEFLGRAVKELNLGGPPSTVLERVAAEHEGSVNYRGFPHGDDGDVHRNARSVVPWGVLAEHRYGRRVSCATIGYTAAPWAATAAWLAADT